ncbi:MAG: hypothetical protein ABII72_04900 [Parcubacteria group bacterium]
MIVFYLTDNDYYCLIFIFLCNKKDQQVLKILLGWYNTKWNLSLRTIAVHIPLKRNHIKPTRAPRSTPPGHASEFNGFIHVARPHELAQEKTRNRQIRISARLPLGWLAKKPSSGELFLFSVTADMRFSWKEPIKN